MSVDLRTSVLSLATEDRYALWELRNALGPSIKSDELVEELTELIRLNALEVVRGDFMSTPTVVSEGASAIRLVRDPSSWLLPDEAHSIQVGVSATERGRELYFGSGPTP